MLAQKSGEECKYDAEELNSTPELQLLTHEEENKVSFFVLDEDHIKKAVQMPLSAEETAGCTYQDILDIHNKTTYPTEVFEMWRGYMESQSHISSKEAVLAQLRHYSDYLNNAERSSATVRAMVSCIAYELKSFPEKYDAVGIMMALAQNGGVCDVQKEIGIRAVYAAMTDSMMQHMKSNALETKVLTLLKKQRVVVSEEVVKDICIKKNYYKPGTKNAVLNSHWITPIQNQMSEHIGIDFAPEPNPTNMGCSTDELMTSFRQKYTVDRIVKLLEFAMNDSHRQLDYQDCVDYFESIRPKEVEDSHVFMSEFVFNMDTGKFNTRAVKFMLLKLGVIKKADPVKVDIVAAEKEVPVDDQEHVNELQLIDCD
eukprot:TRINITY_DN889_c0_g2_i12.p1 TRINITY_DN889_c0_g2~~TRINITY_DN889_c0_g2_i12.p1  ORF type:complete len:370 (-),score=95.75 TRINITY_DN889_c0_g2_i12:61-1170(-)